MSKVFCVDGHRFRFSSAVPGVSSLTFADVESGLAVDIRSEAAEGLIEGDLLARLIEPMAKALLRARQTSEQTNSNAFREG